MSTTDDILKQVPIGTIASRLGVDQATAERAVRAALPKLVSGAQNDSHGSPLSALGGLGGLGALTAMFGNRGRGVDVDQAENTSDEAAQGIDAADREGAVQDAKEAGLDDEKSNKLIRILIPIVIGYLAYRLMNRDNDNAGEDAPGEAGSEAPDKARSEAKGKGKRQGGLIEGGLLDRARDAVFGEREGKGGPR